MSSYDRDIYKVLQDIHQVLLRIADVVESHEQIERGYAEDFDYQVDNDMVDHLDEDPDAVYDEWASHQEALYGDAEQNWLIDREIVNDMRETELHYQELEREMMGI